MVKPAIFFFGGRATELPPTLISLRAHRLCANGCTVAGTSADAALADASLGERSR